MCTSTTNLAEFPTAELETLSLHALQNGDADELARLISAASTQGIFYVSLLDSQLGQELDALVPVIYHWQRAYFDQSQSAKDRDFRVGQRPESDRGYKFCAMDETFEMALEELRNTNYRLPEVLRPARLQLEEFANLSQQVGTEVVRALSLGLGLIGNDSLEQHLNDSTKPSDTALKFVNEPMIADAAEVCDNTHTDNGILSMVWYDGWGFKIKRDTADFGSFTKPTEGRVLIHVANTLQRLTSGRLKSTLHQVTQPYDGAAPRLFIAYNLRPYLE